MSKADKKKTISKQYVSISQLIALAMNGPRPATTPSQSSPPQPSTPPPPPPPPQTTQITPHKNGPEEVVRAIRSPFTVMPGTPIPDHIYLISPYHYISKSQPATAFAISKLAAICSSSSSSTQPTYSWKQKPSLFFPKKSVSCDRFIKIEKNHLTDHVDEVTALGRTDQLPLLSSSNGSSRSSISRSTPRLKCVKLMEKRVQSKYGSIDNPIEILD